MASSLTEKLLRDHLIDGSLEPREEIGIRIDQTLTQDATGTLVMLELEAMGLDRIQTELSAQYVDHNLLQVDHAIRTTTSSRPAATPVARSIQWPENGPSSWPRST